MYKWGVKMSNSRILSLDELSPYVCKVGKQNQVPWKNRYRRIYDYEFIYCSTGVAHVVIKDKEYVMNPGSLILIKPDVPHSFWKDPKAPGEQYWVHFDFVYRKDVYDMDNFMNLHNSLLFKDTLPLSEYIREEIVFENGFSFPDYLDVENYEDMELYFKKLATSFEGHSKLWQLECKVYLLQILNLILNQLNNDSNSYTDIGDSSVSNVILRYIYRNYFRKLSIKELSTLVGLSEDYVGKIFKKQTGSTISKVITQVRLKKAKELLMQTNLSLENIAEMVGFTDAFYLSKAIKKDTRMSPTHFRKQK